MQSIIKGLALFHSGTWIKDSDKVKQVAGVWYSDKEATVKADLQPTNSLMIMEPHASKGAVLYKVKVAANHFGPAKSLDGKYIEVLVDVEQTNYNGKQDTAFKFVKGSVAA